MAVLVAGLFCILITPLIVQGLAGWATSGEFTWPNGHVVDAYGGLLDGHFGTGLRRAVNAGLPPDPVMWLLTILGEVMVLGAAIAAGLWIRDRTGTNSRHGLATARQAAEALGLPRLRKSAAVIRPDLYARPLCRDVRRRSVASRRRNQTAEGKDPSWPHA